MITVSGIYLVMGFALHLIGDIYAHASIVPASYGMPTLFNPYFDVDDFISIPAYLQCMNAIANANGTTSFRTTEFKDYLKNSSSMPQNRYYEDNKNFMPQRIKLSKLSAIKFVSRIHQSGQTFSSSYVIRHYEKDDGTIYDVTLANFAALETRL
ncbi:hypothetical protein [Ruminococcus sp.]|uniref:hypothetical protein n=1 Tax=Ruminococcus sp. TaxID=41978 RepID=UPI00258B34DA|nr:hypothetical protein [Ruminococcus sp.]